jgi:UDP-glucose-4-epimerase GalE
VNNGEEMAHTTEHQYPKQNIKPIKKSILVVGGAGYIGSHIVKTLFKNGYSPVVVGREIKKLPILSQWADCYELDLPRDIYALDEIVKRHNIDTCINTAAHTAVGESVKDPIKYYHNNLVMCIQLLNKLKELNVTNFIFSSSAATYGIPDKGICYDTEKNLHPINPYGKTKLMIEKILQDYWTAYHMRSISLRFFNVGGADLDNEIGESHEIETHIIPLAIKAGFSADEFYLFGDNYNTPDGTCLRDYVHVVDVAEAHLQAVRLINEKIACDSFNIGSGIGTSNMQILDEVQRHTGAMDIVKSPKREGDPDQLIADISRTTQQLNWKPTHSSIDKIVQTAVQWYKHNHRKEIN